MSRLGSTGLRTALVQTDASAAHVSSLLPVLGITCGRFGNTGFLPYTCRWVVLCRGT